MKKLLIIGIISAFPFVGNATVTLPQFFTDSMVIQHDAIHTIPGTAKKNATVKVTPSWGETVKVKADKKGNFKAQIATPACGGPYTITFDDGKKTALNDVWSGDVWFCSGQSNMEMPVEGWGRVMDYKREVETAGNPMVRLLQVQKQTAYGPQDDTKVNMGGWRAVSPETVANFSSIGYFFGRGLNENTGVPVGIIDCTWGGTPIESWMAYGSLERAGEFANDLKTIRDNNFDSNQIVANYQGAYDKWLAEVLPEEIGFDCSVMQQGWPMMPQPGLWEESGLEAFDGIVNFQREFNIPAADAGKPATMSLGMIDDDDITYVNGVKVGETKGYSVSREYEIPAGVLKEGKNVVTVRIVDTGGGGGFWSKPGDMYLHTATAKIPLDGAWQYSVAYDFANNPMPQSPVSPLFPTVLYNAMMHPITVMPVKGVLWYQGCNNVGRSAQYSKLFKTMIEDWRKDWNNPDMPFYFVQLAAYQEPKAFQPNSQWAALRQAQKDALALPNTGMAVAIDLGHPTDIHPKNKQEVARRLLNIALNEQYGKRIPCYAPEVKKVDIDGRYVTLTFDGPVVLYGGGQSFIVKSADGQWAEAYGRLVGETKVEVSSDQIENPVEVRYDWADYPDGDLRGQNGLPVAPFIAK